VGRRLSLSLSLCAAAVLAAVALSFSRMASAQAPADTAIPGDMYFISPDTDVGIPGYGDMLLDDGVQVEFDHPPYNPEAEPPVGRNSNPRLCPLKKPPDNDQGVEVSANGTPPWGQYNWPWPIDEHEHSDTAWYWCDTASEQNYRKTIWVNYHWEDWEADAESGYICVFDADLTFEGMPSSPQSTTEDSPGVFVGKGAPRKHLSVNLVPLDPDNVMPDGFLDGQPHSPPAPYKVTMARGGGVEIYGQQTGGTALTDLEWGWKWNEGQQKFIEQTPPTELWIAPVSAGSGDLYLWLDFDTPQECGAWAPGSMMSASDYVKVTVVDVDLDIDGVLEADEESPGGFMALGGARKRILLNAMPISVGPVKLDVTAGENKVALYSASSGGNPLGNHLEYPNGGLRELWVQGIVHSGSLRDVEIKLDGTAGGQHFTDTVKFTVVGVDLVVDGVSEANEMETGAFVRLNTDDDNVNYQQDIYDAPNSQEDDLVSMSLTVYPVDIDAGNVSLDATAGKSKVKVWPSGTKTGTEVTLPPDPVWTTANMPTQLYLEGYAGSANPKDVELVLQYTGHGVTAEDHTKVTVVGAQVESVTFVSDHGVMTDWTTNFAGSGGNVYSPRGWRRSPAANSPISHTQGLNVTVEVGVTISPGGCQYKLSGLSGVNGLNFQQQDAQTSTGALQTFQLTSAQNDKLDAKVAVVATPIHWQANMTNAVKLGDSGDHVVYVTWGSPGQGPTWKRIDHVCTEANGAASTEAIGDLLQPSTATHTVFSDTGTTDGWALLDGGSGDCDNQARCMALQVDMLGAGPATVQVVHATSDYGEGKCLDLEGPRGNSEYLVLDFDSGPGHNLQAFEGCCETAGYYYAITPSKKAPDDYQMLLVLPGRQFWVRTNGYPPGDERSVVIAILEEVPKQ